MSFTTVVRKRSKLMMSRFSSDRHSQNQKDADQPDRHRHNVEGVAAVELSWVRHGDAAS